MRFVSWSHELYLRVGDSAWKTPFGVLSLYLGR